MTHIVYDGERFYADRKCYRDSGEIVERTKLRQEEVGDEIYTWAFAGGFAECIWGDKIIESGFDRAMIERARGALPNTSEEVFGGLLVVSKKDDSEPNQVYLVNYFGDFMDVEFKYEPIIVGAKSDAILAAWRAYNRTAKHLSRLNEEMYMFTTDKVIFAIECATKNTHFGQDGYAIDHVDLTAKSNDERNLMGKE